MNTKKKDQIVKIIIFVVFLSLGSYFIFIETWLLPVKIIIFVILVLTFKLAIFKKGSDSDK